MLRYKYKIFLVTQVDAENGDMHKKAKAYLDSLVKEKIVKDHRVMYCSTQKGKEALIRQLSAELHIESEVQIVKNLRAFMNKFHFIKDPNVSNTEDID